jgi:hypothetical protein
MTKKEFYIWLAGFIDGEGMIGISRRNGKYPCYIILISITNTDKKTICMIRETLGYGYLQQVVAGKGHLGKKDIWRVRFDKINARILLPKILPYLMVKRIQAEILLKFPIQRRIPKRGIGKGAGRIVDLDTKRIQEKLYGECCKLNSGKYREITIS